MVLQVASQPDAQVSWRTIAGASLQLEAALDKAFASWANVAGLTFTEIADDTLADISFFWSDGVTNGGATYPNPYSMIFLNPQLGANWGNWQEGTYSWLVLVHEIGHALGLAHPHDLGLVSNDTNSIMSYDRGYRPDILLDLPWREVRTPMELDIKTVQELYGHPTINLGNTTWKITDGSALMSIVDEGGVRDTLDFSSLSDGAIINMNPGTWTRIGDPLISGAIWLSEDTNIEAVRGTHGDDVIVTREGERDYVLSGFGNDTVVVSGGDILSGLTKGDVIQVDGDWEVHKLGKKAAKLLNLTKGTIEITVDEVAEAYCLGVTAKVVKSLITDDPFEGS